MCNKAATGPRDSSWFAISSHAPCFSPRIGHKRCLICERVRALMGRKHHEMSGQ